MLADWGVMQPLLTWYLYRCAIAVADEHGARVTSQPLGTTETSNF